MGEWLRKADSALDQPRCCQ